MTDESTVPPFAEGLASYDSLLARKIAAASRPQENASGANFAASVIYLGAVVQTLLIMLIAQGLIPRSVVLAALAAIKDSFGQIAEQVGGDQLPLCQAAAQIDQLAGEIEKLPDVPAFDVQALRASIARLHGAQVAASMTINSVMLMSIAGGAIDIATAKRWIESLSKVAERKIDWNDAAQAITGEALRTKFAETVEHLDNAAAGGTSVDGSLIDPTLADGVLH